jgi:hypothetical protein
MSTRIGITSTILKKPVVDQPTIEHIGRGEETPGHAEQTREQLTADDQNETGERYVEQAPEPPEDRAIGRYLEVAKTTGQQ